MLAEYVKDSVREKIVSNGGIPDDDTINVLTQDCHHHLQNVWIGAVNKRMSLYLNEVLASDLESIDFRLRVTTMFDGVLRAVDKEFSLPANYPKGHGDLFKHWLKEYHPHALLVPVQRTAGSRQDLACEGAATVYWNRRYVPVRYGHTANRDHSLYCLCTFSYYVEFLDECLRSHRDNILQENLFIVLTSLELVSLCRVMAILHFKICMPLRWLAGNTHLLGQMGYDWSSQSMGKAIDALESTLVDIECNGELYLNEDYMSKIFDNIYTDSNGNSAPLKPLQDAMKYMFETK